MLSWMFVVHDFPFRSISQTLIQSTLIWSISLFIDLCPGIMRSLCPPLCQRPGFIDQKWDAIDPSRRSHYDYQSRLSGVPPCDNPTMAIVCTLRQIDGENVKKSIFQFPIFIPDGQICQMTTNKAKETAEYQDIDQ
jgi:hypothetical protein